MLRSRLVPLAGVLLLAACASSQPTERAPSQASGTLEGLAQGPGETVALTPGDGDFAPGPLRFTFLVVAHDGRAISRARATVWLARGLKLKPFERTTATLEPIGVPGVSSAPFGVPTIYVANLHAPAPGKYWVLARPRGARIAALGNVLVAARTASPPTGAAAPRTNTPTLGSTGGKLKRLTTATRPDRELYRYSVAQSLDAHVPFVVAFATPKFCVSRTCGPVVDVVSRVRRDLAGARVRFIHVEVYADNDPAKGYNRWMRQWHLRSEPWVFLVGPDGRIKAKFEGAVSVQELRAAVRRELMR